MPRRLAAYGPAALWAAVLLFVGSRTVVPGPEWPFPVDKVAHFGGYALLGALAALGWLRRLRAEAAQLLLALALLVGAADELNQRTVDGRHADVADWVADALGVVAGFGALRWLARGRVETSHD